MVALLDLVGHQRVADPGADIDMVNVEQLDFLDLRLVELFEVLGTDLVAGLDVELAGLLVDEVERRIADENLLARDQQRLEAVRFRIARSARRHVLAVSETHPPGPRAVDVEGRLVSAPASGG